MRTIAVLAALAAAGAAAHAAPTKPPLTVSTRVLSVGQVMQVSGSDCPPNGAGHGYGITLVNGKFRPEVSTTTESAADGTWHASVPYADEPDRLPAGRYSLEARCYDSAYPHTPYPPVTITLLPRQPIDPHGPLAVTPTVAEAGASITVSGRGFAHGRAPDVGIFLYPSGRYLGSLPAPTAYGGAAQGRVTIPAGTEPGAYRVVATSYNGNGPPANLVLAGQLTIAADPPSPSPTPPAKPSPSPTPEPTEAASVVPSPSDATPSPSASASAPAPVALVVDDTTDGTGLGTVAAAAAAAGTAVAGATLLWIRRRKARDRPDTG